jgi:hypothetical protein
VILKAGSRVEFGKTAFSDLITVFVRDADVRGYSETPFLYTSSKQRHPTIQHSLVQEIFLIKFVAAFKMNKTDASVRASPPISAMHKESENHTDCPITKNATNHFFIEILPHSHGLSSRTHHYSANKKQETANQGE